ncbi:hypothetical protein NEMIN01_1849 [Nematocida minor]|uniref:uncharacterized protein n=1 Tax=Nematocida minor TaxID=1912983 RepID=UPI00221F49CF|nr:uncharacterized protein NEMIN01_1849 [Nematocida minor]KAI5192156.1 hypothetical protein NEMIN01_1849 [Nematocida minor]
MKSRVCILPLGAKISKFSVSEDFTATFPVVVSGYTLIDGEHRGNLVIGLRIYSLLEMKDLLCNFLGYSEIKKGIEELLLPADSAKISDIVEKYEKTGDQPITDEWRTISRYITMNSGGMS